MLLRRVKRLVHGQRGLQPQVVRDGLLLGGLIVRSEKFTFSPTKEHRIQLYLFGKAKKRLRIREQNRKIWHYLVGICV